MLARIILGLVGALFAGVATGLLVVREPEGGEPAEPDPGGEPLPTDPAELIRLGYQAGEATRGAERAAAEAELEELRRRYQEAKRAATTQGPPAADPEGEEAAGAAEEEDDPEDPGEQPDGDEP